MFCFIVKTLKARQQKKSVKINCNVSTSLTLLLWKGLLSSFDWNAFNRKRLAYVCLYIQPHKSTVLQKGQKTSLPVLTSQSPNRGRTDDPLTRVVLPFSVALKRKQTHLDVVTVSCTAAEDLCLCVPVWERGGARCRTWHHSYTSSYINIDLHKCMAGETRFWRSVQKQFVRWEGLNVDRYHEVQSHRWNLLELFCPGRELSEDPGHDVNVTQQLSGLPTHKHPSQSRSFSTVLVLSTIVHIILSYSFDNLKFCRGLYSLQCDPFSLQHCLDIVYC